MELGLSCKDVSLSIDGGWLWVGAVVVTIGVMELMA